MDVEPLRVLDLIGLGHDIATGVLGMEAQHHRMGKRPALTAHVLDIADFQLHFFVNFADQAVFGRLTRLGKPRQRAVDPGDKARRPRQQDLVATGHQHNHARRDARVAAQVTSLAEHRPLPRHLDHGLAATATKTVFPRPGADLRGIGQHFVQPVIALQHEAAQALPTASRHVAGGIEFEQVHRLAVKMADTVFGEHRQVLALEPFPREQRAIGVV